jgi:putative FmdB family regulatory protein
MPIYEFACGKCGHEFEDIVAMSSGAPACPKCGAATERLISGAHFGVKRKVSKKAMEHDAKRSAEKAAAAKPK